MIVFIIKNTSDRTDSLLGIYLGVPCFAFCHGGVVLESPRPSRPAGHYYSSVFRQFGFATISSPLIKSVHLNNQFVKSMKGATAETYMYFCLLITKYFFIFVNNIP